MSNQLATLQNFDLANFASADTLAMINASFNNAKQSLGGGSFHNLSFKGRSFYLKSGGSTIELPTRQLECYIVAMRDTDHLTFFKKGYEDGVEALPEDMFTRDFKDGDLKTKDWIANKPADEQQFKSRTRKRRVVLLLDQDQDERLIAADLGELSVYAPRDLNMGLYSLSQLSAQFDAMRSNNPQAMPFMFKLQMSFTSDSVPVVQFSFIDQMNRNAGEQYRLAPERIVKRALQAWSNNEVQPLLEVASANAQQASSQPVQPAPQAIVQPVQPTQPNTGMDML